MPAITVDDTLVLPRIPRPDPAVSRPRPVAKVVTAHRQTEGAGFVVRRPFPGELSMAEADPFLLLDHVGPQVNGPDEAKGAPWHPHRGFETVSYILDGEIAHHDTNGGGGVIGEGDTQWMTAGGGILHDELPTERMYRDGGPFHAVQLWVNLPPALKMTPPRYQSITTRRAAAAHLRRRRRARSGSSPVTSPGSTGPGVTHTPITYAHVDPRARRAALRAVEPRVQRDRLRAHRPRHRRRRAAGRSRAASSSCSVPATTSWSARRRPAGRAARRAAARRTADPRADRALRTVRDEHPRRDRPGHRGLPGRPARHHPRRPARAPELRVSAILHPPRPGRRRRTQQRRVRGLPAHRRPMGAPAHVHDVRPRRLLRQLAEPPRHRPLPTRSDHPIIQSYEPGEDWWYCYVDDLAFAVDDAPSFAHP